MKNKEILQAIFEKMGVKPFICLIMENYRGNDILSVNLGHSFSQATTNNKGVNVPAYDKSDVIPYYLLEDAINVLIMKGYKVDLKEDFNYDYNTGAGIRTDYIYELTIRPK